MTDPKVKTSLRNTYPVATGLALGALSAVLAERGSDVYQDEKNGKLRATAHAGLPFLVAATSFGGSPSNAARREREGLWRAAFVGVHLVHLRLIFNLIRSGGLAERPVRIAALSGTPTYVLLAIQLALSTPLGSERVGRSRAEGWCELIDDQLLRTYALGSTVGLVRHRRPIPIYVGVGALLGAAVVARRGR